MDDLTGDDDERSRELLGLGFAGAREFARMIVEEGELRGLVGPREVPRLWRRHIMNSVAVAPYLPPVGTVADVGSGAGFPGIVLALVRSDLEFHLIEPMERRITWLVEVIDALGLDNVSLHHVRAEELHGRVTFDVVTARAVAPLDKLARVTVPLVASGGRLLALKGERAAAELDGARYVLKKLEAQESWVHDVDLFADGDLTRVVEILKS